MTTSAGVPPHLGIVPIFTTCSAPTKKSRRGDALKFGYDDLLIYDEPRRMTLKYDLSYFDKIDTLPYAQNVTTTFTPPRRGRNTACYYNRPQALVGRGGR